MRTNDGTIQSLSRAVKGKSVLVTGAAGFIGSHLVEALAAEGAQVTALDDLSAGSWDNLSAVAGAVECVKEDVRRLEAMESLLRRTTPELIFHLAANASVPESVKRPQEDFDVNCGGTVAILEAVRRVQSAARVVLASSGAVYGEPDSLPILESSSVRPISPYGASKASAETEAAIYHRVYGIPVVIARLFNTYGPRMGRFVILDFLRKLRQDPTRLEILGDGRQVRDFNYVSDSVSGLLCLAESGQAGEAYNVASGKAFSISQAAQVLLEALRLEGRTAITCTGSSWEGDAQHWAVNIDKLAGLGYRPRVGLTAGVTRVVDWFRRSNP